MTMKHVRSPRPDAPRGAVDRGTTGIVGQMAATRETPVTDAAGLVLAGFGLLARGVVRAFEALERVRARRRAMARLDAMDDRMLRDIGLSRDGIAAAMRANDDVPPGGFRAVEERAVS